MEETMNYKQAYLIMQKDNPEEKELEEAVITAVLELAKIHERGDPSYAHEVSGYIILHSEVVDKVILDIYKDAASSSHGRWIANFLRGYQLHHNYSGM